jgi:hypothetical protein
MLTGGAQWKESSEPIPTIRFDTIATPTLQKVIEYMHYKQKYNNTKPPHPQFKIDVDITVLLLHAAEYLDL